MSRFRLGVNYWPRRSAMAMWARFDAGEIREDFARISGLGFDSVRFFLRWADFQPAPGEMSRAALGRFETVLDMAAEHGLCTMPTLFCGHMSGVNWLPAWTLEPGRPAGRFRTLTEAGESPHGIGDFYAGGLLEAQRLFARAVGERARDRAESIVAWDLGNEFSNLRAPERPGDAAHWAAALAHDLLETSGAAATAGTHGEDLSQDRGIRLSSLAEPLAFATMHGYPVYSGFARDPADAEVVPFLYELAGSCARKAVMFTELGNPTCPADAAAAGGYACLDETAMAAYATAALERLHARGATGAMWWCWADYAPELARTPPFDGAPHELSFGIVRGDGSEKPVAAALAAFARGERRVVARRHHAIVDETAYYEGLPDSQARAYAAYVAAHPPEEP